MTRWLIGLDDTDNLESRGTGFKARQMAEHLERSQTGLIATSITRHQLLVDPRIPYTSHNSSACISVVFEPNQLNDVIADSTDFLKPSRPLHYYGSCLRNAKTISNT